MSLIDILTKWVLDKADKKLFDKKELTSQQRIEKLYRALDELESVFSSWIEILQPYADGSCNFMHLEKDWKRLEDFLNQPPKSLITTIEHATIESHNLEFLTAREGINDFTETICDNIQNILKALTWIQYELNSWRGIYRTNPELQKEISRYLDQVKTNFSQIGSTKQALLDLSNSLDKKT